MSKLTETTLATQNVASSSCIETAKAEEEVTPSQLSDSAYSSNERKV